MNRATATRGPMRGPRCLIAAALLALSTGTGAQAQTPAPPAGTPAWVVDQFFVQKSFPDKARHLAGEMAEHYPTTPTIGSGLTPEVRATIRAVQADSAKAVYSVYLRTPTHWVDWYAHLVRVDGIWKLSAVRALSLPPLFYAAMDSLGASTQVPDSLRSMLSNMRLTAAPDSALRAFLTANTPALERIATGFARTSVGSIAAAPAGLKAPTEELRGLATQLAALNLSGAYRDADHPACVFVEIGGMIDNEVGFLYAPPGCAVPEMSPERFIYVERVAGSWFLYKTT